MMTRRCTPLLALLGALASCSPHRVRHHPRPPIALPAVYSAPGPSGQLPEQWWRSLGDPELDRLVARALGKNFQLRGAWARVRQSRAVVRQARSGLWPQVELSGDASRTKSRFVLPEPVGEVRPENNSFSLSAAASYELDLWRRIGNGGAAAALEAAASRDDAEAIAMSLAAEVAEAWFDVRAQRAQRRLLTEQLALNQTHLELIELRFRQGVATSLDVYQQRAQVLTTRQRIEQVEAALVLLGNRLALLTSDVPQSRAPEGPDSLPAPPAPPATGIPADLLVRRPDVRAARRLVEAADHRVAVAVADRLPGLRIGGSASLSATEPADLIDAPLWSIFASLVAPIIDGGRRRAEVERNRDVVDERLMGLGQALLEAIAEVENALAGERQRRIEIATIEEQIEVAQAAHEQARARYTEGVIDYLPVLTALQSLQQNQLGLITARRELLSQRIQLYRALGGTWTRALEAPARAEVK
jgi:NodT family efflux transporter outer membrane factor (OMF) lipoprotein